MRKEQKLDDVEMVDMIEGSPTTEKDTDEKTNRKEAVVTANSLISDLQNIANKSVLVRDNRKNQMVELFRDKIPKIKDIEDLEYLFNFLENKTEKNADEVLSILNSPSGFSLLRAKNMTGNHYKEIWKIINDQYNKLTDEKLIYKAPSFWEKFVKQKTLADFKRFLKFPSCREDNGLKNLICFTKEVSKNLDENKKKKLTNQLFQYAVFRGVPLDDIISTVMKKCGLPKTKEIKEIFESTDYRDISTDSYTIAIAVDAFKKFTNTEKNLEKLHSAFNKLVNAKSNRAEYMIPLLYSAAYNNGYSWGDVNTLATKIYKNINSPDKMAQSKWYKLCIDSAKEATYISPSQWKSLLSKVETRDEKLKTNPERRPTK